MLENDNIYEGQPYYYLTKLAAKCTAKRMVPDYISEKKMLEYKVDKNGEGHCFTCMGCRSFLTPYVDENGKPKYYGRFNQGVVTINLVDVACPAAAILISSGRFLTSARAVPQGPDVPPQPPEGHFERRRAHPVAVRRAGPPEEGRAHRQAALRRYSTISLATRACMSAASI